MFTIPVDVYLAFLCDPIGQRHAHFDELVESYVKGFWTTQALGVRSGRAVNHASYAALRLLRDSGRIGADYMVNVRLLPVGEPMEQ